MALLTTELADILHTVQRPGDFYTTGTRDIFAPHLAVAGVGPIALPLLPVQVQQLIAIAEQAPYGRGAATLVDTEVRRTWQIDPARVQIGGRHWAQTLADIVARATAGLGVTGPVVADLYKLLVYDPGSFFVSHRDQEARLDLSCPEPSQVAFAAFYADCVHEVLPITSGYRLALVYNLRRQGRGQLPEPPNYDAEQARVVALLRQ